MALAVNEIKVVGRAFRKLIDQASNKWIRESFWTVASDVEFDDGKTAEEKVGEINGITSDVNRNDRDIASSILPVHNIKSNLDQGIINDKIQLDIDEDGDLVWKGGADSVPKKLGKSIKSISDFFIITNNNEGNCTHIHGWQNLTKDNFSINITEVVQIQRGWIQSSTSPEITYNQETGTVMVNFPGSTGSSINSAFFYSEMGYIGIHFQTVCLCVK